MTQPLLNLSPGAQDWIESAAPLVVARMQGREFTVDDVHGLFFEPGHANWWGCLFSKLQAEGHLEHIGYRKSTRPSANRRVVSVWRMK